jgi:hypothetical protein
MSVIDMAACESTLEMWRSYPHRTPHRTARTPGILIQTSTHPAQGRLQAVHEDYLSLFVGAVEGRAQLDCRG